MIIYTRILAIALLAVGSVGSVAAAPVFNNTAWAGTGCPAGTGLLTGVNSADMSVFFDAYEAGKNASNGLKRSACAFAIPVHVPEGFRISKITVDWGGYIDGKGEFRRKYKIMGSGLAIDPSYVPWKVSHYNEPSGDDFSQHDTFIYDSKSGFGSGKYKLRINSQAKVRNANSYMILNKPLRVRLYFSWVGY